VNNLVPHDAILALAMARELAGAGHDVHVAVAPEGHVYGYFLERLGARVLEVRVGFPPVTIESGLGPSEIEGRSVLVVEDDVMGGATLRLVAAELGRHRPARLDLWLVHSIGIQHPENVPPEYGDVFYAERTLDLRRHDEYEAEFLEEFGRD
jgi:NAD(P)-dependent dehydrogenase (short-subunit alcohol dehydrogenase family)